MPGPSEKPPLPKETDPVGEFLEGYLPPLEDRLARSIAAINRPAGRGANDTPPDNKNGKLVFVRRRKREEEEEAAATADSVPDPLRMDAETETKLKDTWLEQLIAQCNGDPKLAGLAGELQALVGTNPSDTVMQGIEEKLAALTAAAPANPLPAPVPSIKRPVDATPPTVDTKVTTDPPVAAKVPDVSATPSKREQQKAEKEKKRAEALRMLLEQLGGQTEFVLENPKTKAKTECQIDASGVIRKKGEPADQTNWVIDKRTLATPWDVKIKKKIVPAPDVKVTVDPAVSLVVDLDRTSAIPVTTAAVSAPASLPDRTPTPGVDSAVDNKGPAAGVDVPKAPADVPAPPAMRAAPTVDTAPDAGIDKSKEKIRLPNDGEVLFYTTTSGRVMVGYSLGDNRYAITNIDVPGFDEDDLMSVVNATSYNYTADKILLMAKEQGWKPSDPIRPRVGKKEPPVLDDALESKFIPLAAGKKEVYVGKEGRIIVEGLGSGRYKLTDASGEVIDVDCDVDRVHNLARTQEWVPEKNLPVLNQVLTPASPEAPKSVERDMTETERLRILVDEARLEYVRTDYNQGKRWAKITGVINKLRGKERGDTDTQSAFERYRKALTSLMEAELAQLKSSGITGEELKVGMVRILNFYTAGEHMSGEKLNLKLVQQQVEAEDKDKWAGTMVLEQFESLGKWYQKRTVKEKILLGGAGFLMGSTAIATAGTVTGTVTGAAFFLTKVLTSASAGVTADGLMEGCEARLEKWLEEKKREKSMQELGIASTSVKKLSPEGVSPEVLEILSKRAQAQIDGLDDRMKRKKLTKVVRKALAVGVGVGLTAYFTYSRLFSDGVEAAAAAAQEKDTLEAARALGVKVPADVPASGAASAVTTEGGVKLDNADATVKQYLASHPSGGASAELLPGAGPAGAASAAVSGDIPLSREEAYFREVNMTEPMGEPAAVVASAEVSSQVSALREAYPVTAADGRRGLWGVIDERLKQMPETMEPKERNRIIASIQNLMREDLAAMSPVERASAGFAKGDLNLIHKGTVIHFNEFKSLTSERLQAIIDGQSVGAPSGASVADVIDRPTGIPGGSSLINQNLVDEGGVRESAYGTPVSPMDHALNEETITRLADQPMTPQDPTAAVQEVIRGERPAVAPSEGVAPRGVPVADHVVVRPESVVAANETETPLANAHEAALFREACTQNVGALRHDILLTPPAGMTSMRENFHLAKYDYAMNRSLGLINVERVLEASWELHNGTGARSPMNWAKYPLHPTQIDSVARAVAVAQDPRILGRWGAPLSGETIDKYTARIGVALTKANKAQMFSMLLNGRGLRLAA